MENKQTQQKQATWKTLLIIGIVAAALWIFSVFNGNGTPFDLITSLIAGVVAFVGLVGGLIAFITSRKN